MEEKHVVLVGGFADGFSCHGPFDSYEAAVHWGVTNHGEVHVIQLEEPEDES